MRSVCCIGGYYPDYPRTKNLLEGLQENGYRVYEWNIKCQLALLIIRFILWFNKIYREAIRSDFILVPYPGWRMVFFAKVVSFFTQKSLVFDAHISNYNTRVEDRKLIASSSIGAIHEWLLDTITCSLSDIVLIDTNIHGEYFENRFGLKKDKIVRVFVGANISEHENAIESNIEFNGLLLYFYGTYIPLQGVFYIIDALDILKKEGYHFKFILIGAGQEERKCRERIEEYGLEDSIIYYPYIPRSELLSLMKPSDICLGIFGESIKARNVIPNKVYDYAAMNKVFITGKSLAMDELFVEGVDYIGCKFADAEDLANNIKYTIENLSELKTRLNPREKIEKYATPRKIARQLIRDLRTKDVLA